MKFKIFVLSGKKILLFSLIIMLLFTHFMFYFFSGSYKEVIDALSYKLTNSFSPNKQLYEDKDANLYFVFNGINFNLGTNKPKLKLPLNNDWELNNGIVNFSIGEDIVIKSAGKGIVKRIGVLDNDLKFIEIIHSGNIITRYENLKIVGVGVNFNVRSQQILGTLAEEGLVFKIMQNGSVITSYEIINGEIKWEN